MVQIDSSAVKNLLIDLLHPLEQKVSDLSAKLQEICNEMREIKSVIMTNKTDNSTKVTQNAVNNSATSTPASRHSTPSSRPAPATASAPRKQRAAAVRTKEKLAAMTKQPSKFKRLPAKKVLPQIPTAKSEKCVSNENNLNTDNGIINLQKTHEETQNNIVNDTTDNDQFELKTTSLTDQTANQEWETVTSRQQRRRSRKIIPTSIKGSAKNTEVGGVEILKYLHGCFFKNDSTPENVISHLKSIRDGYHYTAELIPAKRNTYKSYKIGIPLSVYDDFLTTTAWPLNTCITEWQPFLRPRETRSPRTSQNKQDTNSTGK